MKVSGKYADAFTFHLSEDVCKRLAGGQFTYSFDYIKFRNPAARRYSTRKAAYQADLDISYNAQRL